MPNMPPANSSLMRHHLGLQQLGLTGLGHSQSMAHLSSDLLTQTLQAQREQQFEQHREAAARVASQQLRGSSPGPFELAAREDTHFQEPAHPLPHFGGEDMGLMDGDMLEMLLRPE